LFIAEAPGHLGGVRYGIPLWGDRTGKNFRAYCAEAGVDLHRAFITNAVLCHPPSPDGRNRTPRQSEMRACCEFLRRQIELVDPRLVVALGRIALESLGLVCPHDIVFGHHVAQPQPWSGRFLASLYHPSGQTLGRRSRADQLRDYRVIAGWQRHSGGA
jgi:DNA polymerase